MGSREVGVELRSTQPITQAWLDAAVLEEKLEAEGMTGLHSHVGQETTITIVVDEEIEEEKAERVIGRITAVAEELGMRPISRRSAWAS